ncbi:molybdenum cofactor cytidylyltransferase [Desulfocicer vacuolatum DSM 3385]|uniref:Molybdopterin molybdenumtransferase n=1 Tax=Desulfocicer vacuolatum DSM 3385 TaxID=1121400 RepID=A0A1W2AXT8_9BACT|nr:molybdopterin-binding protein [Desulfocicer vacuolatum]SMC65360.1 molybdenum cofactor cytidylyltransferase [Desulfocicer vacuolatum DSM 3385]
MKSIPVEKAVGMILCHDITEIVPDIFKGPAFKKGHVITAADIPRMLDIGKRHIYVSDFEGRVHENDAARRIALAASGSGIELTQPVEGKVTFVAQHQGLLKINVEALEKINAIDEVMFATLHTLQTVKEKQDLAGTRIIPLAIEDEKIKAVEEICRTHFPIIEIKPFAPLKVGMIITGSEVFSGRIKDKFGPVVKKKFKDLGSDVFREILVSDDREMTVNAIHELVADGAQMIALTGGMSVDPDDQTPASIRAAGGDVVTYGAPVLPGAMFMISFLDKIPVIGLPGCVMYHRASIFDLIVPRLLAGENVDRMTIAGMGHGGYCSNCKNCRFPICGFGK